MHCARCGAPFDPGDNFCRRCGEPLDHNGLPTVIYRSFLPVPWTLAKGPIVRGVLALIVGTAVELLRREIAKRSSPLNPSTMPAPLYEGKILDDAKKARFPWSRVPKGDYRFTETVIQRQIWFKR